MNPMVDGWKGDDWFHNGAFRQTNFDYLYGQTTARGEGKRMRARRLRRLPVIPRVRLGRMSFATPAGIDAAAF